MSSSTAPSKHAKEIISELKALDQKTFKIVAALSLSTSKDVSSEVRALWAGSTTTLPQILQSAECWNIDLPRMTDIIITTLDQIEAKKSDPSINFLTYRRGGTDDSLDPRVAIAQLSEPDKNNPAALFGLNVLPEDAFEAPLALSEFVEPFDVTQQSLLLTPKYWNSDLHQDTADGISAPMGSCIKIWLCFPPTTKNLELMAEADGQRAKIPRIGKKLEGGLVFRTDSSQAIYLPVGTLHAVYTVVGGFLVGVDLTTPTSSPTYAAIMAAGLTQEGRHQVAIYDRFLLSVDFGLDKNKVDLALKAWVDAEEWIGEWAEGHAEWAKDAVEVWEEYLAKTTSKKRKTCPCGKLKKGGSFVAHFRATHMVKVPGGSKRKRGGSGGGRSTKRRK